VSVDESIHSRRNALEMPAIDRAGTLDLGLTSEERPMKRRVSDRTMTVGLVAALVSLGALLWYGSYQFLIALMGLL